jgi:hypothetical protein
MQIGTVGGLCHELMVYLSVLMYILTPKLDLISAARCNQTTPTPAQKAIEQRIQAPPTNLDEHSCFASAAQHRTCTTRTEWE